MFREVFLFSVVLFFLVIVALVRNFYWEKEGNSITDDDDDFFSFWFISGTPLFSSLLEWRGGLLLLTFS